MLSTIKRGLCLVSRYILPIYSPIIPIEIKISDPIPQTDTIKLDHPEVVWLVKNFINTYISIEMLAINIKTPIYVIRRIGLIFIDVIPSHAKETIFFIEYLLLPAMRLDRE